MSRMESFVNLFPLNTTVSRKVIWFSNIKAVNLWLNLLACSINDPRLSLSQINKTASLKRFHPWYRFHFHVQR